ncbi:hypothetical protein U771_24640 [Pseudomonas gorinensis]|uniref:Uncharacterized protein n=1 Tax=Pseudomonas gorinensis TaxID=3240790 RepID=A0ACA7PBS7_9PSED|nr:hypothetical protein U771_24640 [Pseudomonas sp. TKP]
MVMFSVGDWAKLDFVEEVLQMPCQTIISIKSMV